MLIWIKGLDIAPLFPSVSSPEAGTGLWRECENNRSCAHLISIEWERLLKAKWDAGREWGWNYKIKLFVEEGSIISPPLLICTFTLLLLFSLTESSEVHMTAMVEFKCIIKMSLRDRELTRKDLHTLCAWFGLWCLPELEPYGKGCGLAR